MVMIRVKRRGTNGHASPSLTQNTFYVMNLHSELGAWSVGSHWAAKIGNSQDQDKSARNGTATLVGFRFQYSLNTYILHKGCQKYAQANRS